MLDYTEEKKELLRSKSVEELKDFVLEIPLNKFQDLILKMPSLNGFRPGRGVPLRIHSFLSRIKHWNQREWNTMAKIWVRWSDIYININEVIGLEESKNLEVMVTEIIHAKGNGAFLIEHVVRHSSRKGISEDILRRWYDYSPLSQDNIILGLLMKAPTKEQVEWYNRIESVENQIEQINLKIFDLDNSLKIIKGDWIDTDIINQSVKNIDSKVIDLETSLQGVEKKINYFIDGIDKSFKSLDLLEKNQHKLNNRLTALEDKKNDFVQMKELNLATKDWNNRIEIFGKTMGVLQNSLTRLEVSASFSESIQTQIQSKNSLNDKVIESQKVLLRPLKVECEGPIELLEDTASVFGHTWKNLNRLGITSQQAKTLAFEIISALVSGEMVTFQGSLANSIAESCALSLAGDFVYKIRVPVGLEHTDEFDEQLFVLKEMLHSRKFPISLILEGVNRSAFEAYGLVIRELIIKRILGLDCEGTTFPFLIFSTINDSPTNIPCGKEIIELGPIFHTDSLNWKNINASIPVPGIVLNEFFKEIYNLPAEKMEWDDLGFPNWLQFKGGVVWKKSIISSALALGKLKDEKDIVKISSSLVFGWILPMVFAISPSVIGELINEFEKDDRIKALLLINSDVIE